MKIYKNIGLIWLILLWMAGVALASTPENVKISNVTQTQFTVSWITDVDEIGYILWGTNTNLLNEIGLDDRDQRYGTPTIKDDIHHVTVITTPSMPIKSLTTYYYKIVSGTQTSAVDSITTGTETTGGASNPVFGYIYRGTVTVPGLGIIVYLNLAGTTSGISALRSFLIVSDGFWTDSPGNFRTSDLMTSFPYSSDDNLCIYVEGGNNATATLIQKISESNPASDIILPPDSTPPGTSTVTDDGTYTTNNIQLHATWQAQDLESGIAEYQYAIGTSQGGTDTVDWTSVGTETEVTKGGLNLQHGQVYYFSVKVKNRAGDWSNIGYSDGIKVIRYLAPKIPVYPNPFVSGKEHDFITFGGINEDRLTKEVTIKIFTIAGELVYKIEQSDCNGQIEWTPPNNLASGIYIYLITNPIGEQAKGKLGIIK